MGEKGIIEHPELLKLGEPLPPGNPHGISVHLPTWEDTLGWAKRDPRVVDTMKTGYPRFFIPRVIERLADRLLEHFTRKDKHALIVSTGHHALMCRQFFRQKVDPNSSKVTFPILIAHWDGTITPVREHEHLPITIKAQPLPPLGQEDIFLVPYPVDMFPSAKSFWQHTGFGISSRRATYWMECAPFFHYSTPFLPVSPSDIFLYPTGMSSIAALSTAIKSLVLSTPSSTPNPSDPPRIPSVALFGFLYVDTLKLLSSLLGFSLHLFPYSTPLSSLSESLEGDLQIDLLVTEFPGNPLMQSPDVSGLYKLSRRYGFALVVDDTVGGTGANVNVLGKCDAVVSSMTKMVSGGCDVMGGCLVLNPRAEGGRYKVLKEMLEGGDTNGGMEGIGAGGEKKRDSGYAAGLNGEIEGVRGKREIKEEARSEITPKEQGAQRREEERAWFLADIAVMERNSRNFVHRVRKASANAEWLVHNLLRPHTSVQEVYYPKGSPTEDIYEQFRVKPTDDYEQFRVKPTDESPEEEGGYGFLVSIKFLTPAKARAFYDAMAVAKGPSLGTNFTLCCAYTLLAHYRELEWAAEFGVVEDLVRISVGLEDKEWLGERVSRALKAAGECDE
ncbi:PLP-dependent transferase [Neurospora tetrasperma FGSC 2509]|nr:PLP-dependent transferase [Neurospora tetrasperma FGSC 2509]